jgi:metal-dependent amidase/aminoacylase/carboxypeptidase family protein
MLPTLQKSAGIENVLVMPPMTGAEDFAFFAQKVPGLFFFVGGLPKGSDPKTSGPHHTPEFMIDDSAFKTGVSAMTYSLNQFAGVLQASCPPVNQFLSYSTA